MSDCDHFTDGICTIASRLSGRDVIPWENVCKTCTSCESPRQVNYVTAMIACRAWIRDANDQQTAARLRREFHSKGLFNIGRKIDVVDLGPGGGTTLHKHLQVLGFEITPDCPCLYWVRQMNLHGSAWSRAQAGNIAAAMVTEFKRRYPQRAVEMLDPAVTVVAKRLIMRACREWDNQQVTK